MPTSPLYDSTRTTLAARLPDVRDSQLDTLALVVVGITQSVSAQLGKIARAMPLDTTQYAKEQRLRRFLDNQRITQAEHYQPLVLKALSGLKGQKVQLLLDRVLLHDRHNLLVVSIGCRRRSIPLAWQALDHRGKSSLADQQAVLSQALATLPERVRVTVHGDSEFRGRELFTWLRSQRCDAMLGVYGNTFVSLSADGPRQMLQDWLWSHQRDRLVGQERRWRVDGAWCDDQPAGYLADLSARESADVDRNCVPRLAERGLSPRSMWYHRSRSCRASAVAAGNRVFVAGQPGTLGGEARLPPVDR